VNRDEKDTDEKRREEREIMRDISTNSLTVFVFKKMYTREKM
jgi:hypothetical protein